MYICVHIYRFCFVFYDQYNTKAYKLYRVMLH